MNEISKVGKSSTATINKKVCDGDAENWLE